MAAVQSQDLCIWGCCWMWLTHYIARKLGVFLIAEKLWVTAVYVELPRQNTVDHDSWWLRRHKSCVTASESLDLRWQTLPWRRNTSYCMLFMSTCYVDSPTLDVNKREIQLCRQEDICKDTLVTFSVDVTVRDSTGTIYDVIWMREVPKAVESETLTFKREYLTYSRAELGTLIFL